MHGEEGQAWQGVSVSPHTAVECGQTLALTLTLIGQIVLRVISCYHLPHRILEGDHGLTRLETGLALGG